MGGPDSAPKETSISMLLRRVAMDFATGSPVGVATSLETVGSEAAEVAAARSVKSSQAYYEAASEADDANGDLGAVFRETEPVLRLPRVFFALFGLAADLSIAKSSRFFPALI